MLNTPLFLAQAEAPAPVTPAVPVTPATPVVPAATPATTAVETVPTTPPAEGEQQKPEGIMGLLSSPMVMLVLFIVIFYVLLIRPQNKARKEHQQRLQSIERGDKVITNAGIHGIVEHVGDTTVNVKISEGVIITMEKQAVSFLDKKGK